MTEDMLREEFSKYGNVQSVKVIQGKGFCFIEFDDHDAVDWCNCKFILYFINFRNPIYINYV